MQEFFEVWGLHGFNGITLLMSVLMNSFEIIAGVALLIGWQIRLFIWLLLALILFFTFLTGYTVFTGKPKNCGCFGDCLPVTSFTSFMKDLVLLVMIVFLLFKIRYIKAVSTLKPAAVYILVSAFFCVAFQWYTLNYLPVIDCLPFKKGNNISEKMKMPANAVPTAL
ncbi:MAG: hypothetical protein IPH18_01540 [Chitinophagaceae bacterium]|nr:hypothetical protein [Chitinophagaceae bacterium]